MAEPTSRQEPAYGEGRDRIRRGGLRGEELLAWLAGITPQRRERAIEHLLGIEEYPLAPTHLEAELIGYVPSGVGSIVRAVFDAPVVRGDLFVDLGAGLGKAAMVTHLLSGARVRGIELQPELVARANARAEQLGLSDVSFVAADARVAPLDDGDVFFLYLPFTGAVLTAVLERLRVVAARRDVVVCALGFDLPRTDWLKLRPTDAFWLSIYDSHREGREPRAGREPARLSPLAEAVAFERAVRPATAAEPFVGPDELAP